MFRRRTPNPSRAAKRAQKTGTQDLVFWVGIILPKIDEFLRIDTEESLKEAEEYASSLHAILMELRIRKRHHAL